MSTIETSSRKGTDAVKKLRERKLKSGLPFMINVKELSTNQCYLEYPNGNIQLITLVKSTKELDIIRELTPVEANELRKRFEFSTLN